MLSLLAHLLEMMQVTWNTALPIDTSAILEELGQPSGSVTNLYAPRLSATHQVVRPTDSNHCKVQTTLPALREQGFRFEGQTGFPFTISIQDTKRLTGRTSSAAD